MQRKKICLIRTSQKQTAEEILIIMKKLMIMGAGIYQVPLIRKAREMGIYTIAVSIPGDYPGFALADEVCLINTTDEEAVLAAAKEKKIDGIVTVGTDVAVITIGRVCRELGLCGIPYEAAKICSDKSTMKQAFAEAGVRTAAFRKISLSEQPEDIPKLVRDLKYPLIVKTVDSSGSRGITRIDSAGQLPAAIESVKKVTRKDYYLIEEFITGTDFGAQAMISHGKVLFLLPHGNYQFRGDTGVPAGHYVSFEMEPDALADLEEQMMRAIRGIGLDNCAVNADLILKDGKTYLVEIAGRSGATGLSELNSVYYGFDLYEQIILLALGAGTVRTGDCSLCGIPCACTLLKSSRAGRIIRQENRNTGDDPRIVEIVLDHQPGDMVRAFHVGPDRIGHAITKGKTLADAEEALEKATENIILEVEEKP